MQRNQYLFLILMLCVLPYPLQAQTKAQESFEQGLREFERGNSRAAFDLFSAAIDGGYPDVVVFYNRGLVCISLEQYELAMRDFDTVIETNPGFATAYLQRGVVYALTSRFDAAISEFDRAIILNPSFAEAYQNRAYAYVRNGTLLQALQDYNTFLKLEPSSATGFYFRGIVQFRLGNPNPALKDLTQAIKLDPNDPYAYIDRAYVYESLGRWKEAEADKQFASTLKGIDPAHPQGLIEFEQGKVTSRSNEAASAYQANQNRNSNWDDDDDSDDWVDEDEADDLGGLASEIIQDVQSSINSSSGSSSVSISSSGSSIRQIQRSGDGDGPSSESWEQGGSSPPDVEITGIYRGVYGGLDVIEVSADVVVEGRVTDSDGIAEVTVDGRTATVDRNGRFKGSVRSEGSGASVSIYARDKRGAYTRYTARYSDIPDVRPHPPVEVDTRPPEITVTTPKVQRMRGFDIVTRDQSVFVSGIALDASGVQSVSINEQQTQLDQSGKFNLSVALFPGENTLTVRAVDGAGNSGVARFTILREDGPPVGTDTTPPLITIISPEVSSTRGLDVVARETLLSVRGIARDEGGVRSVSVNRRDAKLSADGGFEALVHLEQGETVITVSAADMAGNIGSMQFTVVRKKDDTIEPVRPVANTRKDRAILFATDDYEEWQDLNNPIKDAKALAEELEAAYGFQVEVITDATRKLVLETLRNYAEASYNPQDQLLIFFAGHGYHDKLIGPALVATDSKAKGVDLAGSSYISFSDLRTRIDRIPCEHVLLVMDVCHGGLIDQQIASRGDDGYSDVHDDLFISRKLSIRTRLYLTSGGDEYVPDGRPDRHSPFMWRFLEALRGYGGRDRILTARELLNSMDRLENMPRLGSFGSDEPASDFLFIARRHE